MSNLQKLIVSSGLFLSMSSGLRADTYEVVDFSHLYKIADSVRLVRIISAEVNKNAPIRCRFKYKVENLINFKGAMNNEFFQSAPALVDSRYFLIGKASHNCGHSGVSIDLPEVGALFPVLPYSIDWPADESWVAFGGSEIKFPRDIRLAVGAACNIPFARSSVDPCPVPLPAANLTDLKKLLTRLSNQDLRLQKPFTVGPSPVSIVGSDKLAIRPSRDPSSLTGVLIPKTLPEAVSELRKSLPTLYLRSLSPRDGNGATVCRSDDEDDDLLVIDWMKQFWMLRDKDNYIVKSSGFELRGEMYPDLVANSILNSLCIVAAGR